LDIGEERLLRGLPERGLSCDAHRFEALLPLH